MSLFQVEGLIEGYQYSFRVKAVNLGSTVNYFPLLTRLFFCFQLHFPFVTGTVELLPSLGAIGNDDGEDEVCQSHLQAARHVRH